MKTRRRTAKFAACIGRNGKSREQSVEIRNFIERYASQVIDIKRELSIDLGGIEVTI
jgi:hypothetical protein